MWEICRSSFSALIYYHLVEFCRYGVSPFEYALGESGGSLQLAVVNAQIKWPTGPKPSYPEALHQFVSWMLQPQAAVRPRIDDIIIHVDKLIAKFSNWVTTYYGIEQLRHGYTLQAFKTFMCLSCDIWTDQKAIQLYKFLASQCFMCIFFVFGCSLGSRALGLLLFLSFLHNFFTLVIYAMANLPVFSSGFMRA